MWPLITALPALFSLTEFVSDWKFVLKIFILMTLISFVINHVGKGPVAIVLILGISWFVLVEAFWFFGGVYLLYLLLLFGVTQVLIDFFFVGGGMGGGEPQQGGAVSSPVSSGVDILKRNQGLAAARRRMMR